MTMCETCVHWREAQGYRFCGTFFAPCAKLEADRPKTYVTSQTYACSAYEKKD